MLNLIQSFTHIDQEISDEIYSEGKIKDEKELGLFWSFKYANNHYLLAIEKGLIYHII